MDDRDDHILNP